MAGVVVELSADESKLLRAYQRVRDSQQKLDDGLKKVKNRTNEVGQASRDANAKQGQLFSPANVTRIAAYAAGVLGASGAIGKLTGAMREAIEEGDRLAGRQSDSARGLGPLAQLAAISDNPKETMARLIAESEASYSEGARRSTGEAGFLQFAISSANLAQYRKAIAAMEATGAVEDSGALTTAVSALHKSMGKESVGGFEQVVSKGLGASAGAPALVEQIIGAAAKGGAAAVELGIDDKEMLAAVALLAGIQGDPAEGGTQVASFMQQVEKYGITKGYLKKGDTLRGYVKQIQEQEENGASVFDILGARKEAIAAYRGMRNNPEEMARNLEKVNKGLRNDAFGQMIQLAEEFDILSAPMIKQKAIAGEELAGKRAATRANLEQAVMADVKRGVRERGGSDLDVLITGMWAQFDRFMYKWGNDSRFLEEYSREARPETQEAVQNFLEASRMQLEAAQSQAVSTDNANAAAQRTAAAGVAQ